MSKLTPEQIETELQEKTSMLKDEAYTEEEIKKIKGRIKYLKKVTKAKGDNSDTTSVNSCKSNMSEKKTSRVGFASSVEIKEEQGPGEAPKEHEYVPMYDETNPEIKDPAEPLVDPTSDDPPANRWGIRKIGAPRPEPEVVSETPQPNEQAIPDSSNPIMKMFKRAPEEPQLKRTRGSLLKSIKNLEQILNLDPADYSKKSDSELDTIQTVMASQAKKTILTTTNIATMLYIKGLSTLVENSNPYMREVGCEMVDFRQNLEHYRKEIAECIEEEFSNRPDVLKIARSLFTGFAGIGMYTSAAALNSYKYVSVPSQAPPLPDQKKD